MVREKQLGRAIQRTLTILQLFLKTMKFVSLDESESLRTKISGFDPQIYPGTFQCFVPNRELPFKNFRQLRMWKPGMKPRYKRLRNTTSRINHTWIRLDSHVFIGNENLYIYFLGKVLHGDENNVCL